MRSQTHKELSILHPSSSLDTDHVNFPDSSIYNRIATTPATPSNSPLATFNPLAEPVAEALGAGIVVEVGGAPDGAILVVVVFA